MLVINSKSKFKSKKVKALTTFLIFNFCFLLSLVAQQTEHGLHFAEDFQSLPYFKTGIQTYQYSSTDPQEDQFNDYSHWLYTDKDSDAVLVDVKGPGTIYRIWSTGNIGDTNRIKIFIDGETKPRLDETFNEFHNHKPLRDKPQVGSGGDHYLAWWSYMPIPFAKSIKIVREGNFRPFYNITYHTYTDTTNVVSWTRNEDVSKLETMWNDVIKDPKPQAGNQTKNSTVKLNAHESKTVFDVDGSGYIASLKINNYLPDKNLKIKMYWDDDTTAAVDAPLKWFFGSIDNGGDVKALGVGTINNNGYCYFPMPFWKHAKLMLVNDADTATSNMQIEVAYNPKAYPENECAYFHATANETDTPNGKYQCLKTTGHGHVIGMAKRMPKGGHACEGDEIYFIDGRKFPDIYGTGEEDYSNNAWWQNSYNSYPTHGCISNDCYYRMHYPDMLVFESAIDMEFESWANYYTASLVWYYKKDEPATKKTDSIDVMNNANEQQHDFIIHDETWKGEKTGIYPGIKIYKNSVRDDGRAFSGDCNFKAAIDKNNNGIRIRVRTEHENLQGVKVFINEKEVTERPWIIMKNNFDALWVDSDFEVPSSYTKNKDEVEIKLVHLPGYKNWTAYRYDIFSYMQE